MNDGSRDGTEAAIVAAARGNRNIKLLNLSRNFGKEAALAARPAHASGRAVVPIDVDMQDPPELLEKMALMWKEGAKIVNAKRVDRSSNSWLKRQTSGWFYRVYNSLAEQPISANVGDFRLLDREVVEVLKGLNEHSRFGEGPVLLGRLHDHRRRVRTAAPRRRHDQMAYGRLWGLAVDGIVASTTIPLRIATWLGLLFGFFRLSTDFTSSSIR